MRKMLNSAIENRQIMERSNSSLRKINDTFLIDTFNKLDYQKLFGTLKYDLENNYNC